MKRSEPPSLDQIRASVEAFKERKRYNVLTPDVLSSIPDDQLEQAILDFVRCKTKSSGASQRDVLDALSEGFRAVYSTWWVEAEVNNGGFNQYFWNSSGQFAKDAVAGFTLLGATDRAQLMARAIAIHEKDQARMKRFKAQGTLEAFSQSYEGNPLDPLDEEFLKFDDLSASRIRFIREHTSQFVGRCEAG